MKRLLVLLSLFVFLFWSFTAVCVATSEDEAWLKIGKAEDDVGPAFEAVMEAERMGADVYELLVNLGSAGSLLSEAKTFFRTGDFGNAVNSADLASKSVEGLVEEAQQLEASASAKYREMCFRTVAASGVAVVIIVLGTVVGWMLFKRRYLEKVLKMKPEVVEG